MRDIFFFFFLWKSEKKKETTPSPFQTMHDGSDDRECRDFVHPRRHFCAEALKRPLITCARQERDNLWQETDILSVVIGVNNCYEIILNEKIVNEKIVSFAQEVGVSTACAKLTASLLRSERINRGVKIYVISGTYDMGL